MKIICIGRNYAEHAKELNNAIPEQPVFFIKPDSAILKNNVPFYIPDFSQEIHYEIELAVKIMKPGKSIPVQFAKDYYKEITVGIDFTARDLQQNQKEKGLPWEIAKAFDFSAVIGDFILLEDITENPIKFHLTKNNEAVQLGSSSEMIYSIDEIISQASQFFTLKIGDVIFTGTPKGVGKIQAGDILEGWIGDKKLLRTQVKA